MSLDLDQIRTWASFVAFFIMFGFWLSEVRHSNAIQGLAVEAISELGSCVRIGEGKLERVVKELNNILGVE